MICDMKIDWNMLYDMRKFRIDDELKWNYEIECEMIFELDGVMKLNQWYPINYLNELDIVGML